jgi:hypothetical protein
MNSVAVNTGMKVTLLYPGYIPRSGITGLYGSSFLNFLKDLHIGFRSTCTNLHSHQQYISVPVSPHPHQHLLLFVFLKIDILTG